MDAITQFQQQFAEPVYGFVGAYWPFLLVMAVILGTALVPRWRDGNGAVIDMSVDGDSDGGSDGGGGDGGGGGD